MDHRFQVALLRGTDSGSQRRLVDARHPCGVMVIDNLYYVGMLRRQVRHHLGGLPGRVHGAGRHSVLGAMPVGAGQRRAGTVEVGRGARVRALGITRPEYGVFRIEQIQRVHHPAVELSAQYLFHCHGVGIRPRAVVANGMNMHIR